MVLITFRLRQVSREKGIITPLDNILCMVIRMDVIMVGVINLILCLPNNLTRPGHMDFTITPKKIRFLLHFNHILHPFEVIPPQRPSEYSLKFPSILIEEDIHKNYVKYKMIVKFKSYYYTAENIIVNTVLGHPTIYFPVLL